MISLFSLEHISNIIKNKAVAACVFDTLTVCINHKDDKQFIYGEIEKCLTYIMNDLPV